MDLRKQAEELAGYVTCAPGDIIIRTIEAKLREIRNETLEEAAQICEDFNCSKLHPDARIRRCCAALDAASQQIRTYALAASGDGDITNCES